jgi:hypothetical protein
MLEDLVIDLEGTAHWRRTLIENYPDDPRNEAAAELLERLKTEIQSRPDSAVANELEQLDEQLLRLSDGNRRYDLSDLSEECSEYRRRIGFSEFPPDGDAYLMRLLNIYKEHRDRAESVTNSKDPEQGASSQAESVPEAATPAGGMLNTAREASDDELCLDVDDYAEILAELFSHADDGEFCFAIYGDN